jgi:A/G-specific adenine glycosylase
MVLSKESRAAFVRGLLRWGRANRRPFPWRKETDPFRILIAEVLLQRSRGTTVARIYEDLFERWPTPGDLAKASVGEIKELIRPLGLTNRAFFLKAIAADVDSRGGVPRSVEELLRFTGVGRYAANATAAAAFEVRTPTVDGTSARVYRRFFGLCASKDSSVDDELWELVEKVSPRQGSREWNWAVLDLAAMICLPRAPRCPECPLNRRCVTGKARIQESVTVGG